LSSKLAHRALDPEAARVGLLSEIAQRLQLGTAVGDQLLERLLAVVSALHTSSSWPEPRRILPWQFGFAELQMVFFQ
jgi:hypothetical protein